MHFLRRLPPLFYLGLLPVICLSWLWADSMQARMSLRFAGIRNESLGIATQPAVIHFHKTEATEILPGFMPRSPAGASGGGGSLKGFSREELSLPAGRWFAMPALGVNGVAYDGNFSYTTRSMDLPFWLVLLSYLLLWLSLAWLQARRREIMRHAAMPLEDGHHE